MFIHNDVHDNNNGDVPEAGNAEQRGRSGTGMTLSGGRNDTVMDNTFTNNGAWGTPSSRIPTARCQLHQKCSETTAATEISGLGCVFETENDALEGNTYFHDGFYGNPSNADFGQIPPAQWLARQLLLRQQRAELQCAGQPRAAPAHVRRHHHDHQQRQHAARGGRVRHAGPAVCPARTNYPPQTGVHLEPMPQGLPTMANPCAGVPSNPWCTSSGSSLGTRLATVRTSRRSVWWDFGLPAHRGPQAFIRRPPPARPRASRSLAPRRLAGAVGDQQHAALAGGGQDTVDHLVGQAGIEPAGRLVEDQDRPRREQGPGHGQPPALAPRDGHAVLTDRRVESLGERGHPLGQPGGRQRGVDLGLRRLGMPEGHVRAHGAGEELGALVGQGAGAAGVRLRQLRHVDVAERSVPDSSGQYRNNALTTLDLPAPLDPVSASRSPLPRRRLTPSSARGNSGR